VKIPILALALWCAAAMSVPAFGQANVAAAPPADPFQALGFLEGTWDANVQNTASVTLSGRYSFVPELGGHVLVRHSTSDAGCKAPADFDCKHGDLLYVFQDFPGAPLKAIYFDNEGHVIHYDVTTPTPTSVVFLSATGQGPQFKLNYELKAGVMTGKFQMLPPGQTEWHTYLEWSGSKK
jgi:hypothetical protein